MKRLAGLIPMAALVFTIACGGQTDAGITADVKTSLASDESVSAFDVDVDTREGVVTLTGTVPSMMAKDRAVEIARTSDGVRDVIDNLRVGEAAPTTGVGADFDTDLGDRVGEGAREAGDAVQRGAEATGDALRRAGEATRDAVTDDER
jgi:hypothetical protein